MDQVEKNRLKNIANRIRVGAVTAVHSASSGHPGGSLSIADALAYLYFKELRIDPKQPDAGWRDRLVLSKGHCSPALYAALAERGYFPPEELKNFRRLGHFLQGHPDMKSIPGVDMTTGSLGQGISAACGMALAGKISGKDYRVYAIVGDGESQEGQVWEAAMFAAHYKLDNLCLYLDFNGLQIDGPVAEVMNPSPLDKKFEAFGWNTVNIDAHCFDALEAAFGLARTAKGMPTAIIAKSVKGKGVSFMENNYSWHGTAPNDEQFAAALGDLEKLFVPSNG